MHSVCLTNSLAKIILGHSCRYITKYFFPFRHVQLIWCCGESLKLDAVPVTIFRSNAPLSAKPIFSSLVTYSTSISWENVKIRPSPARLIWMKSFHFAVNPFSKNRSYKPLLFHTNHTLLRDGDDCNKSQRVVWASAPVADAKSAPICSYSTDCLED